MAPLVEPPRRRRRGGVPGWRRVLALADQGMPTLLRLWRRLLRQARSQVRHGRLDTALETHVLEAEATVAQVLDTTLDQPARREGTVAGLALALAAAQAVRPDIEAQTGTTVSLTFDQAETRYQFAQYIGTQVRDLVQTTQRTVRQTLRRGTQAGLGAADLAREVRRVIGLTPAQARARDALRARLEAQGLSAREVQAQLSAATEQALQRRALLIARTQSVDLAQRGALQAWQDAVRAGAVEADAVRKFWIVVEDPRLCPGCASIPDMNQEGVALDATFATPWGPLLTPTAHPACRCSVAYRVRTS